MINERIKPILKEVSHDSYEVGAIVHIETDSDCKILKFGNEIGIACAGEDKVIRLRKGKHKLTFISLENNKIKHSMVYQVEDNEMEDFILVELRSALDKCCNYFSNMVLVEGATFSMGDNEYDGRPVHSVTLSNYYIGKYPVTQKLWFEVMGSNPSYFEGDNLPVERVNWYECISFCNALSRHNGLEECYCIDGESVTLLSEKHGYRLPTEAEWEFAARGGKKSKGFKYAGSDIPDEVAWYNYKFNSEGYKTYPVGQKRANELGVFDMSGNIWEWCWDWKDAYPSTSQTNPLGPDSGISRVCRGGSWSSSAVICRATYRGSNDPTDSKSFIGFRLVLVL